MEQQVEIDIIPFLLEAFAHNQLMRKDIDNLYQQNKYKYYKLAKESEYYNHLILLEGDIYRQEYGRKALGIILYACENEAIADEIMKLIKKHYRKIYNLVTKNDVIDMNLIKNHIFDNNPEKVSQIPEDEINSIFTILVFLCQEFDKRLEENLSKKIFEGLMERVMFYDPNYSRKISYDKLYPQLLDRTKSLKERIYNNIKEIKSFNDLISVEDEYIANWNNAIGFIFDYENMSSHSVYENVKFTEQDVEEILSAYFHNHKNQNLENACKFLSSGIYIKYLLKAYKQLKEYYFQNNKETMYVELEGLEKENNILKKQIQDMLEKIDYQNKVIEKLKEQVRNEYKRAEDMFIKQIKGLKEQNKQLIQEIEQLKRNENELIALREMMFSLEKEEYYRVDEEIDIKSINHTGILIVGGHSNWQNQIKDKLPNVRIVDTEALNFNPDSLSGIMLIIFNTAYMNHAMYYKMINYARNNNIKIGYITNQNIDLSIRQIYKIAKN